MVEIFLQEFRKAVRNDKWQFVCRKKNIDFLALIGWTEEVAVEYLAENLEKKHYVRGPDNEKDPKHSPGFVYVFRMAIENFDVYIKIKKVAMHDFFVIISFHESEGEEI